MFNCGIEEDTFKNLVGLTRYNNGAWKSHKQRKFMLEHRLLAVDPCFPRNQDNASMFGVELPDGASGLILEGNVRWANYGHKSFRRVGWFFVIDKIGIAAQYKLHYTYDDKAGFSQVNSEKTELLFKRDESVVGPEEVIPEPATELQWIGEVGQRIEMHLFQKYSNIIGQNSYGNVWFTVWEDEQKNKLFYFNKLDDGDDANGIDCKFTVKEHTTDKKTGQKVTIIGRMSLTKQQKCINILKG